MITQGDIVKYTIPNPGEEREINLVLEIYDREKFKSVKLMCINSGLHFPPVIVIAIEDYRELTKIAELSEFQDIETAIKFYSEKEPLLKK